jgi:hypothetical protein
MEISIWPIRQTYRWNFSVVESSLCEPNLYSVWPPEDHRSAPPDIPLRADHVCCSPAGPCDVRGVMLHPVQDPPASGSLPPRMFPRGIPSAALPDAVTSSLRHAAPAPARFQARYHSHPPATTCPTARRAAVPAPPRFRSASPPPASPPTPAAKMLRAQACGIMFVSHIMPPAPQESRRDALGIALRERVDGVSPRMVTFS